MVTDGRAERRPVLDELGTGQHDDEDRPVAGGGEQPLDELEQALVGPVEVLEDEHRRAPVRDPLEQGPPRGGQLFRAARRRALETEQGRQPRLDAGPLLGVGQVLGGHRGELRAGDVGRIRLGDPRPPADHLPERPERQALAVRRRSALVPVDQLDEPVDVLLELPGQPALADPGDPQDRHEPGTPVAGRGVEQLLEQAQLVLASDERGLETGRPAEPAAARDHSRGPPGRNRQLLAPQWLVAQRLVDDRRFRRPHGRLAHEDRARRRDRLEPRCGVHEVAGHHPLAVGCERHGRLAGHHRAANGDRRAVGGLQRADRVDQVERGAHGAFGIVLERHRRPPDGHDGVTDELLDRAAVATDPLAGKREVAVEELADRLRVALVRQGGEARRGRRTGC